MGLSWIRRGRVPPVCGIATPALSATLEEFAAGLGHAGVRLHDADAPGVPDVGGATTVLVAVDAAAALALAARLAGAQGGGEILVLAEDPLLQIDLRDLDAGLPDGVRVRPVSRTAIAARRLFAAHPPDRVVRMAAPDDMLTVVIAGTAGALAAQLLLAALRLLQLPGIRPAIHLAGPDMPELLTSLRKSLPELDRCGEIGAADTPAAAAAASLVIATDDIANGIDTAGVLRVALPTWRDVGEAMRGGGDDRIARAVHALHLEERRAAGSPDGARPSQVGWAVLPERFREASRHQADHIAAKLRWAGARIAGTGGAAGGGFGWTAAELAALTEAEHARWATVSRLEGWSFGPVREDAAKTTPLLVPFAALDDDIRDLDALPVRAAPQHLGAPIRRDVVAQLAPSDAMPGRGFEAGFTAALAALAEPALVLRLTDETALSQAVAAVAQRAGVPFQLALTAPPTTGLARHADRIFVGAHAVSRLPAPWLEIGPDGRIIA